MNKLSLKNLLLKYHCRGGRYSLFPQRQNWKNNQNYHDWIASLEKNYNEDEGVDLYIHIPFCESLCTFCGCNIAITKNHQVEIEYIDLLLKEWKSYTDAFPKIKISSVYLGGGTPNFLQPKSLDKLLNGLKSYKQGFTATIEADPRHLKEAQLEVLKDFNFKRISFGVQDFNEMILDNLNRPQTFMQVQEATLLAREFGIEEISYDLIYGLPMQTMDTMRETVGLLEKLKPDAVAFYPLATVPWQKQSQNALSIWQNQSISCRYDLYLEGNEVLGQLGFKNLGFGHYLGANGATADAFETGNLKRNIMGFTPSRSPQIIGLGASAISYSGNSFFQNDKILAKYSHQISSSKRGTENCSHLQSPFEKELMNFYEEFTCKSSVSLEKILPFYSEEKKQELYQALQYFIDDQLLVLSGEQIKLTHLGNHFIKNICQVFDPNHTA